MTALLSNLQSLTSKAFPVTSILTSLAFWFLNGVMLFWLSEPFRQYVHRTFWTTSSAGQAALLTGAVLVGTAMWAYMLSALTTRLRLLLEGTGWGWMSAWFVPAQAELRERLDLGIVGLQRLRSGLETKAQSWKDTLRAARAAGTTNHGNTNVFTVVDAERHLRALRRLRRRGDLLSEKALEAALTGLAGALESNNAEDAGNPELDRAQQELVLCIDHAVERAAYEHIRLLSERQLSFGAHAIAPTAMGNIARGLQTYAVSHYQFTFEPFWSRLQQTIQKDDKAAPTLQDSKAQLDFLVLCCWMTGLWWVTWTIVLARMSTQWLPFALVAIGGPILTYFWYRVAVEHYLVFADTLRAIIDRSRFALLRDLHVALPADTVEEEAIWDALTRRIVFDEAVSLKYQHPTP
jgi:hypothetical protein